MTTDLPLHLRQQHQKSVPSTKNTSLLIHHSTSTSLTYLTQPFSLPIALTSLLHTPGMDPAGPWFYDNPESSRLDKTDADFVQVIHTNGGGMLAVRKGGCAVGGSQRGKIPLMPVI
uniref:Lipase domain-containing protein n=1 Tax=Scylla olivacea TaxID=85551 RepID=A0A0P4W513_SCYOL